MRSLDEIDRIAAKFGVAIVSCCAVLACSGVDETDGLLPYGGDGMALAIGGGSNVPVAGSGGTSGDYVARGSEPAMVLALTPDLTNGAQLWRDQGCATCHGEDGTGSVIGSDLTAALSTKTDLELVDVLYYGGTTNPAMVPFGGPGKLTDQELADLFGYLKATFGGM